MHKHHDFPMMPPMDHPPMDIMKELNHIYSLIENICTFKKVDFYAQDWTQNSKGYYIYEMPCQDYFVLAAYKEVDGGADEKLQHKMNTKGTMVTVTATEPCDGYFAVAQVGNDCEFENPIYTVDRELNENSLNAVSNSAVTAELNIINAKLLECVPDPDVLHKDDIADWAKAEAKPCYTWEDICAKPNFISKVVYNGEVISHRRDILDITKTIDSAIKNNVEDIVVDKVNGIINDTNLQNNVNKLMVDLKSQENKLASLKSSLEEKDDEIEDKILDLKNSLRTLTNKQGSDLSNILNAMTNGDNTVYARCIALVETVKNELKNLREDSEAEDNRLHADISALAYKCRIEHQILEDLISENSNKIKKISDSLLAVGDYSQISDAIDRVNGSIRDIKSQVEDQHSLMQAQIIENTKTVNSNKTAVAVLRDIVNANTEDIAANIDAIKALSDTVDNEIETVNSTIETTKNNLKNEIGKDRKRIDAAEKAIEGVQNSVAELEEKIPEIVEKLDVTKVTESEINGNIKVNGEELVVYRAEEVDVPTKVSQLENDLKFITKKEASGLVASAQVNFDNAFVDDDLDNVTYIKTVNISSSQGSVIINGDEVKINIDGVSTVGEMLKEFAAKLEALESEINILKEATEGASFIVTDVLPSKSEAKSGVIYAVRNTKNPEADDKYIEYMLVDGDWETIGSSTVDMTEYLKQEDLQPISEEDIKAIFNA